jgi:putative copper resistance protein D
VEQLLSVYPYFSVVARGLLLSLQSLVIGGVSFLALILPSAHGASRFEIQHVELRIRRVLFWCSIALAVIQVLYLASNSALLMSTAGLRFAEIVGAHFFVVSSVIVIASLGLAWLLRSHKPIWSAVGAVSVIVFGSVATSHASSRIDHRLVIGVLDLLHQAAGGMWIGGLPILWIALRATNNSNLTTSICKRFSRLAIAGVAVVLLAGIGLGLFYLDTPNAVYGTAYGVMLLGKFGLFLVLVGIGALNKSIVSRLHGGMSLLLQHLRRNLEAEIGIGFTVLLAAASLTSQPPASDLPEGRVSLREAGDHLTPRWPRLSGPTASELTMPGRELLRLEAEKAGRAFAYIPGTTPPHPESPSDKAWSDYNHNWAGVILVAVAILALLSQCSRVKLSRHWPLLFIALAIFILVRADPENWPLGPNPFWESFLEPDVFQHRTFAALIVAFAVSEWRVQTGRSNRRWQPFVFPALCGLGGALLFAHSHAIGNNRVYTLIEWSHVPIATFAVLAGWARWAELRSAAGNATRLKYVWTACFLIIGSLLVFYREP